MALANEIQLPAYIKLQEPSPYWCIVHNRTATYILLREGMKACPKCDPNLGGIMAPCRCICCPVEKIGDAIQKKFQENEGNETDSIR